jgi:uncharacterized membrane protein
MTATEPGAPVAPLRVPTVPPRLQGLVARILRTGTVLAALLLAAGTVLFLARGGGDVLSAPLTLGAGPVGALLRSEPAGAVVLVGLLVLLGTPLSRVVASAGLFAAAGDRDFTKLTVFVLAVLLSTILVGVLLQ